MTATCRLQAIDLDCALAGRPVLHSLSLAVHAAEILAVVGPNGAGKTTLLRSFCRLVRPLRGQVLLDDRNIWAASRSWTARRIALMPQQQSHDWPFTVGEYVALGRLPHRGWWQPLTQSDRQLIDRILDRLSLGAERDRPIGQLSGGEWQRARLAQALAQEPQLLLLDEPTAHLDLRFQIGMLEILRELAHRDGLGIVVTMHDLNQAGHWADRVALLDHGRLIANGPPGAVLTPDHVQTVYQVAVAVQPHPVFGTPFITPLKEVRP